MKLSELKGKPVVSIADARRVGAVEDVLVDTVFRRLTALRVGGDGHGRDYLVAIENVRGIGPDAVTVGSQDDLKPSERASYLSGYPSLRSVINSRLVSDRGEAIGRVREVRVDSVARLVESFEYVTGLIDSILDRPHVVRASDILGVGPGVVTLRPGAQTTPVGTTSGHGAAQAGHEAGPEPGHDAFEAAGGKQAEQPTTERSGAEPAKGAGEPPRGEESTVRIVPDESEDERQLGEHSERYTGPGPVPGQPTTERPDEDRRE